MQEVIEKLIKSLRKKGLHEVADSIAARKPSPEMGGKAHYMTNGALHDAWAWQIIENARLQGELAKALDALQLASAELFVIGVMGLHRTALTAADKARAVLNELEKTE